MKLYCVTYDTPHNGVQRAWYPSKREAEKGKAYWEADEYEVYGVKQVDVPTSKRGLLFFLNEECTGQGG